ncbi:hypothetical protein G5C51_26215 [Streptomyces sp. A7024]|uniref:FAD-binding domain-containing protein n=1 Tax=Streptomyces coryli TaxID=1128680 RepID=A0A6G4U7W0_9ACTN|nr:hypothetical protein [Streptomyces coryli]
MDPVIVVGAGPVGLALSLVLGSYGVNTVLLDGGGGEDEARQARTVVLRPDTAAFLERLGCGPVLREDGLRLALNLRNGRAIAGSKAHAPGGASSHDNPESPSNVGAGAAFISALRRITESFRFVTYRTAYACPSGCSAKGCDRRLDVAVGTDVRPCARGR